MSRAVLPEDRLHPAIRGVVAQNHADIVAEVQAAVGAHAVVVVGLEGNPTARKAPQTLKAAGVAFHALQYGSYVSQWRRRNALKMWTGWPTFPMVFVRGQLVGGADDLARLQASGELAALLK
jgi:monothiol glutaredoxin